MARLLKQVWGSYAVPLPISHTMRLVSTMIKGAVGDQITPGVAKDVVGAQCSDLQYNVLEPLRDQLYEEFQ